MFPVFFNHCLFSPLSATWASTTRPRCSTSETAPSTPWTDLSSSPMPLALPSGYTTCPCLKRPKQCSRFDCHHREQTKRRDMCADDHMTPFFPFRRRTSAHRSLSLPTSPATSSPFSSGQSDPPFTSTATSCSSQTLPSSTCLFEPTRVSWRYNSKH